MKVGFFLLKLPLTSFMREDAEVLIQIWQPNIVSLLELQEPSIQALKMEILCKLCLSIVFGSFVSSEFTGDRKTQQDQQHLEENFWHQIRPKVLSHQGQGWDGAYVLSTRKMLSVSASVF